MQFEVRPYGVNEGFLAITRNGTSCVLTPESAWNGLIRLNHRATGRSATAEPHIVFRVGEVGWDGDRFRRRGAAAPVIIDPWMLDLLCRRGLLNDTEAETLLHDSAPDDGSEPDSALMLRAVLGGCTFTPIYENRPAPFGTQSAPQVVGFALRTLADSDAFILGQRRGLPVLDARTRTHLRAQFPAP